MVKRFSMRVGRQRGAKAEELKSRFAMSTVGGGRVENRVLNDYAKSAPAGLSSMGVEAYAPGAAQPKDRPGVAKGLQGARGGLSGKTTRKPR